MIMTGESSAIAPDGDPRCGNHDGIVSRTVPWSHQRKAIDFMRPRDAVMLGMGMGTGKTKVIIDLIVNLGLKRVLILAPKSVVKDEVWPEQINTHACHSDMFKSLTLYGGSVAKRSEKFSEVINSTPPSKPLVVTINYESAWRDPMGPKLIRQHWDLVVLDESHRVKAAGSKISMFCARLRKSASRRACLSGTPMPNSQLDVYGQYRFLDPSIFGTNATLFKQRYAVLGGPDGKWVVGYRNEKELQDKFHRIAYVVDRDVLDLPEEIEIIRTFELPAKAKQVYKQIENEFYAEIEEGEVTVTNGLTKVLRLHQVTSGFVRNDNEVIEQVHDAKAALFEDVLTDIGKDESVVVFVQFRPDFGQVRDRVERLGRRYYEVSGRADQLKEWEKHGGVLAVQYRAGSEGLDMTKARYCVYYSLSTLGPFQQSKARVSRPGQKHNVTFIYLLAGSQRKRDTIDQKMYQALQDKANVVRSIIERKY